MCAMRVGASDTDAYLAEWRKAEPVPVGDDLEAEADKAPAALDAEVRPASDWSRWSRRAGVKMAERQTSSTTAKARPAQRARAFRSGGRRRHPGDTGSRRRRRRRDYKPADVSPQRRVQRRYSIRLWSVRHSRFLEWLYSRFADVFLLLHPLWKAIGYARAEAPVKFVEKRRQGAACSTAACAASACCRRPACRCPMNCPKQLRNGPCGGVRANGNCEVEPNMPCVWVQGVGRLAATWRDGDAILHRPEAGRPVAARDLGLAARDRAGRRRTREGRKERA